MICPNCGSSTKDGSRFCEECGARLEAEAAFQSDAFYGYEAGQMGPAPGYSRRIDSDSVQAALKKNRRVTRLLGVVAVIVPLIGFGIYGKVSDAMELWEALLAGVVISVIMAVTMIIVFLKNKFSKSFEGTLTGKKPSPASVSSRQISAGPSFPPVRKQAGFPRQTAASTSQSVPWAVKSSQSCQGLRSLAAKSWTLETPGTTRTSLSFSLGSRRRAPDRKPISPLKRTAMCSLSVPSTASVIVSAVTASIRGLS